MPESEQPLPCLDCGALTTLGLGATRGGYRVMLCPRCVSRYDSLWQLFERMNAGFHEAPTPHGPEGR